MSGAYCIAKRQNDDSSAAAWNAIEPITLDNHMWPTNDYFPRVEVRSYYSDDALHIQFRAFEENPKITFYSYNDSVCKDSCVEFFVQPTPATDSRYLNFEFNAAGTLLLGLATGRGDIALVEGLDTEMFQIQPATGLTDAASGQTYWSLEFRIPFDFLRGLFSDFRAESGAVMRGNFYKCGDETQFEHYVTWHPMTSEVPDFHVSADFGEIRFV